MSTYINQKRLEAERADAHFSKELERVYGRFSQARYLNEHTDRDVERAMYQKLLADAYYTIALLQDKMK